MAKRKKRANESWGDEYSVWRDYSNPREVDDMPNPDDYLKKDKPVGMGSDPMTEKTEKNDHPVVINWFHGKKKPRNV
jgi:hypothetical protein